METIRVTTLGMRCPQPVLMLAHHARELARPWPTRAGLEPSLEQFVRDGDIERVRPSPGAKRDHQDPIPRLSLVEDRREPARAKQPVGDARHVALTGGGVAFERNRVALIVVLGQLFRAWNGCYELEAATEAATHRVAALHEALRKPRIAADETGRAVNAGGRGVHLEFDRFPEVLG